MAGLKFFERIRLVLLDPKKYFNLIEKETGIKHAFVYFIILFLFYSLISLGVSMVFVGPFMSFWQNMVGMANIPILSPTMLVPGFFIGIPLGIIGVFLITVILHVWIMLFGGKGSYEKTFQLYVYGHTPKYLFGWIPIISAFIWIWVMIVQIFGTIKLHKITMSRSVMVYLTPILIIIGLVLLFLILSLMLVGGSLFASMFALKGL